MPPSVGRRHSSRRLSPGAGGSSAPTQRLWNSGSQSSQSTRAAHITATAQQGNAKTWKLRWAFSTGLHPLANTCGHLWHRLYKDQRQSHSAQHRGKHVDCLDSTAKLTRTSSGTWLPRHAQLLEVPLVPPSHKHQCALQTCTVQKYICAEKVNLLAWLGQCFAHEQPRSLHSAPRMHCFSAADAFFADTHRMGIGASDTSAESGLNKLFSTAEPLGRLICTACSLRSNISLARKTYGQTNSAEETLPFSRTAPLIAPASA